MQDVKSLPRLPLENAKYMKRSSGNCLWGAWAEVLASQEVDISKFTSFVLLTSRLRGPFLPAYAQVCPSPNDSVTAMDFSAVKSVL